MNVLKGIDISPRLVADARAVLLAVIVAAIEAIIKVLTGESFGGEWAAYAPIAVLVLRALEGEVDQRLKSDQNTTSTPQPAPPSVPPAAPPPAPPTTPPAAPVG